MGKHVVFFHQNYPAQFGPITEFLVKNYDMTVSFFSEHLSKPVFPGIRHYRFKPDNREPLEPTYFFSRYFEQEARSMFGAYQSVQGANLGSADAFIGHVGFGNLMFLHVAYPEVPSIGFFEIFYTPFAPKETGRSQYPVPKENMLRVPLRNATQILELEYCTKGYSPTPFQRSTYPKAYQHKIDVIFDGVDTHLYQPGEVSGDSQLKRTWPSDAKIVTYVARGLEAFRGFDIFMETAYRICQKRSDVHFVIAGKPETCYGSEMITVKEPTFKDFVLKQRPFDLSRFHFLDWIPEPALVDLYRLSDCHVYWTVSHTLSWSFFQALSTGAMVVGSDTPPVRDVLVDGVNGRMVEQYNINAWVDTILEVLDNPQRYVSHRQAARGTILDNYSLEVCLPRLTEFYLSGAPASPRTDDADKVPVL